MTKRQIKKPKKQTAERADGVTRKSLPCELENRLRAVWLRIGHLIDWCDNDKSWLRMFYSEARPYREAFHWEAMAEMVSDYTLDHPEAPPESVLTDSLVAIQCAPSPDEPERLKEFRRRWAHIVVRSATEIDAVFKADLDLATQDGSYQTVARLCVADRAKLEKDKESVTD